LEGSLSYHAAQLLRVQRPEELQEVALNQETRRALLFAFQTFYALQIPDFGEMRTFTVLQTVLS
jgi:DNA repair protein RecO (recombination protein O)